MARSAIGVTEVVTGELVPLPGIGSGIGEPTDATFEIEPEAGAVTVRFRFVVAPAVSRPNDHVTIPALAVPPAEALTKLTFTGSASVTITPVAPEGPKFVT